MQSLRRPERLTCQGQVRQLEHLTSSTYLTMILFCGDRRGRRAPKHFRSYTVNDGGRSDGGWGGMGWVESGMLVSRLRPHPPCVSDRYRTVTHIAEYVKRFRPCQNCHGQLVTQLSIYTSYLCCLAFRQFLHGNLNSNFLQNHQSTKTLTHRQ